MSLLIVVCSLTSKLHMSGSDEEESFHFIYKNFLTFVPFMWN